MLSKVNDGKPSPRRVRQAHGGANDQEQPPMQHHLPQAALLQEQMVEGVESANMFTFSPRTQDEDEGTAPATIDVRLNNKKNGSGK